MAELIDVPYSYLEKKRIDAHTIEHTPKDLDVSGKVVAIVDDMISTEVRFAELVTHLEGRGLLKYMLHVPMGYSPRGLSPN